MNKPIDGSLSQQFEDKGYVIIDTHLQDAVLDGARTDLQDFFGDDREHPIHVPYADFNRVQDGWHISQNVLAIAQCQTVLDALETLYHCVPRPFQTLNFYKGTQQAVHADSIHFNCEPFGLMCGVWVALEDIGPDQGPLVYYPGSHKLPEMNYDDLGLEGDYDNYPKYLGELERLIEEHGFEPEYGLLKRGQAVIWSANVMHGGSRQHNLALSRHSQVTHYYMGNPKCWRPSESKTQRAYFEPDWVRDVSSEPYSFPIPEVPPPSILRPIEFMRRVKGAIKRRLSN